MREAEKHDALAKQIEVEMMQLLDRRSALVKRSYPGNKSSPIPPTSSLNQQFPLKNFSSFL